jgi:DNA mismatch repair ATPase MutL
LKAAKQHDLAGWALGDALLAECKDQDNGPTGYDAVVAELLGHGIEYTSRYLRLLRQTAEDFPKTRRYDGEHNTPIVALRAHTEAGNPDTLDVIVKVAKREGHSLDLRYVGDVLRQVRAEETEKRREDRKQAEREEAEAEAEKTTAESRRKHAKTDEDEKQAKRDRDRAEEKRKEATQRKRATKHAPPRRKTKPPREEDIGPLAAKAFFMKSANEARRLAARALKTLRPHIDDLSEAAAGGLKDAALSVANEWRATAAEIKPTKKSRAHLTAVNE